MKLSFAPLVGGYAICRLPALAPYPDWAVGDLVSITRAKDELSIVCPSPCIPKGITAEAGWRALRVDTLAALDTAGVVMAAITPISSAGFGVFVISTHLRDYMLVRETAFDAVCADLRAAGHSVQ